ncbi:GNAT family N-acetyltransferase [Eubacteriales bacterium OttesenSCG-928-M02]|nr:GNAT family N-acetyltransferase [Eubacteriales bacterium OttesenSCG-928-M02]
MLDKSIPYWNMIMRAEKETIYAIQPPALPVGFSYRMYTPGDMDRWAEIETSVGEFPNIEDAQAYFTKKYLPFESQMTERLCFVVADDGDYCATAMAWYFDGEDDTHWAALNWVATKPAYQGKGLGSAIVKKALSLFPALEPEEDIYLHTQSWSHPAVGLYLRLGFHVCKTEVFAHYKNDYDKAIVDLKGVMDPTAYQRMLDTAK